MKQHNKTIFFRSETGLPAETLGPAFRSNAIFFPMGFNPLKNGITAAIGAILPSSLPRIKFFQCLTILLITLLSITANPWQAQAHSPDVSSTLLAQQKDGTWVLQIRASLTAFEYEVNVRYGENAYDTPEKFQELVLNHIKENLSINFNQQECADLQNGFVKLGHETNVVFKIAELPENFESITVKNSSFQHIHRNQSALIVLKEGIAKEQFMLNEKNKHTATLVVNQAKFALKPLK